MEIKEFIFSGFIEIDLEMLNYPSGGTYLEICDRPLRVKKTNFSITLN